MGKITINQDSLKTRRDWKRHQVNPGANVFRILPPFGEVEVHNNYPFRKWSTTWLVDPRNGKRRPFATPQTDGEKTDPVREYSETLKVFIEKTKAALKAKNLSDEQISKRMKGLNEIAWQVRVQHTYVYNACDKSGEVGLLELKSTAHKGLKKMMSQYIKEYGQDPTSLNSDLKDDSGVWFNITKEGEGKETTYGVTFNQTKKKTADGEVIKVDDRSPLSDNIVENFADLGYDLNSVYTRKTYEELKDILLYNLAILAKETPECVLEGYDISDIDLSALEGDQAPAAEEAAAEEVEEAPVAKKANNVKIRLDDADDVDDDAPVAKKVSAPVAAAAGKKANGAVPKDILAMADDILGE